MAFYSYIFSANYKKFLKNLKEVSKKEHKNYIGMMFDTVYCVFKYGLGLSDYLNFKIYNRNKEERKEYVSTRMENEFYSKVSPSEYKDLFSVKPKFLQEFKEYVNREFIFPNENNYQEFLQFLDRHPVFMSKPYNGLGGSNVKKEYDKDIENKKTYFDNAVENGIFLEELVIQHPDMNVLCE